MPRPEQLYREDYVLVIIARHTDLKPRTRIHDTHVFDYIMKAVGMLVGIRTNHTCVMLNVACLAAIR